MNQIYMRFFIYLFILKKEEPDIYEDTVLATNSIQSVASKD